MLHISRPCCIHRQSLLLLTLVFFARQSRVAANLADEHGTSFKQKSRSSAPRESIHGEAILAVTKRSASA